MDVQHRVHFRRRQLHQRHGPQKIGQWHLSLPPEKGGQKVVAPVLPTSKARCTNAPTINRKTFKRGTFLEKNWNSTNLWVLTIQQAAGSPGVCSPYDFTNPDLSTFDLGSWKALKAPCSEHSKTACHKIEPIIACLVDPCIDHHGKSAGFPTQRCAPTVYVVQKPMPHRPLHDTLKGEEGVSNATAILTWLLLKTMQNPQVHVIKISLSTHHDGRQWMRRGRMCCFNYGKEDNVRNQVLL